MNLSLRTVSGLGVLIGIALVGSLYTAESKANTLLYISPNDYNYSVRLLHPYYDYWFAQGPLLEPIAFAALKAKINELTICKVNETADTIIRIKPSVFYNPQMRVYHSKLVATVYSGGGNMLGTYIGEAQQQGFISVDNGTKYHLKKVYTLAMNDLMTKLPVNQPAEAAKAETKLACGFIGNQTEPRVNFY